MGWQRSGPTWLSLARALLLCALVVFSLPGCKSTASGGMVELDDDSVDASVTDGAPWLLILFSPHCRHCHTALAAISDAQQNFREVSVAKMNVQKCYATATRFQIDAVPGIYFVKNLRMHKFTGAYTAEAISKFVDDCVHGRSRAPATPWHSNPFHPVRRVSTNLLRLPKNAVKQAARYQDKLGLSQNAMIGVLAGAIVLAAALFVVFLDVMLAASPRLMRTPHEHQT